MNSEESLSTADYQALSEFRYQLRRFLHFSEAAAKAEGLTPLQYVLMLHIKGYPGREWALVGELAERLQMQQHGVVALISRCERLGLVERRQSCVDRRQVEVHLLPGGAERLGRMAARHRGELRSLSAAFQLACAAAFNNESDEKS